jgi:SAM-dependent methyltransferase
MKAQRQAGPRSWNTRAFEEAFQRTIVDGQFVEDRGYYPRYRARYRETIKYVCEMEVPRPARVLEIGGGQLAILMKELWNDHVAVMDISGEYGPYLSRFHIDLEVCDLVHDTPGKSNFFDVVVMAEVIEHLAVPPYVVLAKIRNLLGPKGYLLVTTPNVHRLKNMVRMLMARDHAAFFQNPGPGQALGHIMEYSRPHLQWQLEKAGFTVERIDYRQFQHHPCHWGERLLYWFGNPLFLRPAWRDNLVAVARRRDGIC